MSQRVFNFNPGPATLPRSVLEEASRGIVEINGSGMSLLEISHRGKDYEAIHFDARDRLLRLMDLDPTQYDVIFMGGGASLQFAMLPMNFLAEGKSADFIHTGEWSARAIQEAKRFGKPNVAASSEAERFSRLPKEWKLTKNAQYVHITTNNTIEGTEWFELPDTQGVPLVADASSDILALKRDYKRFSLIYAGAQKNLGPAGVTVIVAKKDFLAKASDQVPTILSYKTYVKNDSLYNTPPTYAIYVMGLVLKWIDESGGLAAIESLNREKARIIYSALDAFPTVYEPTVQEQSDRSLMNITFRLRDSGKEKEFLAGAETRGMMGLKGHRSVGGVRASIYNAFPIEGARALAEYLREFAERRV